MRNSTTFLSFLAAVGACVCGASTPAHACSALPCEPPGIAPRVAQLPLNASHVVVTSSDSTQVTVEEISGGNVVGPADFDTFEVGKHYRVSALASCEFFDPVASTLEFEVTAAAPLPTSLGATTVIGSGVGSVPVAVGNGSCWDYVQVGYTDVHADFAGVDPAIRAALVGYRLIVDGEAFSWPLSENGHYEDENGGDPSGDEAWRKPGAARLWTWCPGLNQDDAGAADGVGYGLTAGSHEAYITAIIPDANRTQVRSEPVTVLVACPAEPADAGMTDPPADAGMTDPPADAGAASADGGRPFDDGAIKQPASKHEKSGCSVAHGPASAGSAFFAMLVAAALVPARIRRARSRRPAARS